MFCYGVELPEIIDWPVIAFRWAVGDLTYLGAINVGEDCLPCI